MKPPDPTGSRQSGDGIERPESPSQPRSPEWQAIAGAIESDRLLTDFEALCGFGGRFAGTESEKAAVEWLKGRLQEDFGRPPQIVTLPHDGWRRKGQRLVCLEPRGGELACHALVWSPSTLGDGLEAEVVDLGRGTPDEITARAGEVRGRIALVRHEYMFSAETVHRRVKYEAARAAGAAGFLIANRLPGELLVTGSSGRNSPDDIPAAGITQEGAAALAGTGVPRPRIRLVIETETIPSSAECLIVELPGRRPDWVVLSAHIDGHPLAESAIDNATGLAATLAVGRAMAPHMHDMERGLRICLFNLEEWGVAGSARYLDEMAEDARDAIILNINLDAIAGDSVLTALTSDFLKLEPFLGRVAQTAGMPLGFHRPLMRNSDHFNFARHGIPAVRLVAGFNRPDSALRYVLTPADRRDLVRPADLRAATLLAAAITLAACREAGLNLRNEPGT